MENRYLVVFVLILGILSGLALSNLVTPSTVTAANTDDDTKTTSTYSGSGEVKVEDVSFTLQESTTRKEFKKEAVGER